MCSKSQFCKFSLVQKSQGEIFLALTLLGKKKIAADQRGGNSSGISVCNSLETRKKNRIASIYRFSTTLCSCAHMNALVGN